MTKTLANRLHLKQRLFMLRMTEVSRMSLPDYRNISIRLDRVDLNPTQRHVSEGKLPQLEAVEHLNQVVNIHETGNLDGLPASSFKKQCIREERIKSTGEASSSYSSLPSIAAKISEKKAYITICRRKAWISRSYPKGCGRSTSEVHKLSIQKPKQKEESSPDKQRKLTTKKSSLVARKSCHLQLTDRMSNANAIAKTYLQEKKRRFLPSYKRHTSLGSSQSTDASIRFRVKAKHTLRLFQFLCRKFAQEKESFIPVDGNKSDVVHGPRNRVDLRAFGLLKEKGLLLAEGKSLIGDVPGIKIGDEFHYRMELCLTGLHKPPMAGIDFVNINGKRLATSIVSSGMYSDIMDGTDVLLYEGEGGGFFTSKSKMKPHPGDQKPLRGNLALMNSRDTQNPVRVIFGFKEKKPGACQDGTARVLTTYVYDGLYKVEEYWSETGNKGFNVYKFKLRRIPNQPQIPFREITTLKQSIARDGLCMKDISMGKEKMPIPAINTVDKDLPSHFKYTSRMIYPSWYTRGKPRGCDCIGECVDPSICYCAGKNGGDFPFNRDGAIVTVKSLVFECGPACRCSASCRNRVSQHGLKLQLEIFKTEARGWGVRSLESIPSGAFVCEYTGELLSENESQAKGCESSDDYTFAIGNNYTDDALEKHLSTFIPDLLEKDEEEETEISGYDIDAARCGGIGRFINHSCDPNLYAKNILYDHDDKRAPHVMFFAIENIPPLEELSYRYNCKVDQFYGSEGSLKQKACCCGAAGCSGRLY